MKKSRLDQELVSRKIVDTIKLSQAYIMAGEVLVNNQTVLKADFKVKEKDIISIKQKSPYVSRGGDKIAGVFKKFDINIKDIKAIDIGISTGGFSDYLLQKGANKVIGIDVNIRQVDLKLQNNPNVFLIEKNVRYLKKEDLPFIPDLAVMDLSFISISTVLPIISEIIPDVDIVSLIKPQFEAKRNEVGKGGIIKEAKEREKIILRLFEKIESYNYSLLNFTKASLKGQKGNQEYFVHLKMSKTNKTKKDFIKEVVHAI